MGLIAIYFLLLSFFFRSANSEQIVPDLSSPSKLFQTDNEAIHAIVSRLQEWMTEVGEPTMQEQRLPFVTLSYAQTLDGMIASKRRSSNLPISCSESLVMTHAIRAIHDAILVGGATMKADNPRLNVRFWKCENGRQPRPVILDSHLTQTPRDCRVVNAIICCSHEAADLYYRVKSKSLKIDKKPLPDGELFRDDIDILTCDMNPSGPGMNLKDVLQKLLLKYGIRSVMVEGGSSILSSFLDSGLANAVCATIAPSVMGANRGLGAFQHLGCTEGINDEMTLAHLHSATFFPLASDVILLAKV
jgi:diaminohydroxyphosphoribosylaminopyrimidine deaminase/5-amino-6-(5-phosphoribosylamino)uracil reductase